jgi:hypothetical protein
MSAIFVVKRLAIHIQNLIPAFNGVASDRNNSFNIIKLGILRKLENYNVVAMGFFYRDESRPLKGDLDAVDEFVDQKMIADQQGRQHGTGRYFKGLDYECSYKKGKDKGNDYRFCILAKG